MLLIIFFSFLIFFTFSKLSIDDFETSIVKLLLSVFLSISILGGLILINLIFNSKISGYNEYFFPYIFVIIISIYNIVKFERRNLSIVKKNTSNIYVSIKNLPFSIKSFLVLIVLASIGPINHPDATDYHVGAIFQNIHQGVDFDKTSKYLGLTGLGEWVNILFFYEGNVWLIRTTNVIFLILLVCFFNVIKVNRLFIILFLSMPVVIQWISIGKPMFLADVTLSVLLVRFLIRTNKDNIIWLFYACILSIGFKITAILHILISSLLILINYKRLTYIYEYISLKNLILLTFFCIITFSIFYLRFEWFSNPFYPFYFEIFHESENFFKSFQYELMNYNKDVWYWPIIPFFPTGINSLASTTFPIIIILLILTSYNLRQDKEVQKFIIFGWLSFFLILFFAQPRGDYFTFPIIILLCSTCKINLKSSTSITFNYLISIQVIFTTLLLLFLIYQNFIAIFDYEKTMNKYASGYKISRVVKALEEPVLIYNHRQARLFYDFKFVENEKFHRCEIEKNFQLCLQTFTVNSFIINEALFNNKGLFELNNWHCKKININEAKRNPLSTKIFKGIICNKE